MWFDFNCSYQIPPKLWQRSAALWILLLHCKLALVRWVRTHSTGCASDGCSTHSWASSSRCVCGIGSDNLIIWNQSVGAMNAFMSTAYIQQNNFIPRHYGIRSERSCTRALGQYMHWTYRGRQHTSSFQLNSNEIFKSTSHIWLFMFYLITFPNAIVFGRVSKVCSLFGCTPLQSDFVHWSDC